MPVSSRPERVAVTSRSGTGRPAVPALLRRADPPPVAGATDSSSVFHSPQPGHCPVQASAWCPQPVQTNFFFAFATERCMERPPR